MQLRIISKLGSETLHNNVNLVIYTIWTIYGNSNIYIISTIDDKSYMYTIRTSDGNLYNYTSEKKSFIYKKIKTISSHHQNKFFYQNIFSITNNSISTFFFIFLMINDKITK